MQLRITRNVQAERIQAALVSREWSFTSERARHAGFLLAKGTAEIRLDSGVRSMEGPGYCWLPHGAAPAMRLGAGGSGYLVSFDDEVCGRISDRSDDGAALAQASRRLAFVNSAELRPVLDELVTSFSTVVRETRVVERGSDALIAAHIELILLHTWRLAGAPAPLRQTAPARSLTFERFSELVDQHFPEHWAVSKFAETLGVTEDQLHAICTRETGRGPLAILHARIIETARVRLETSIVPIEQIASRLGFSDAGYFNRFFKKRVGTSPGAYRRGAIAQRLKERGEAFAAWP